MGEITSFLCMHHHGDYYFVNKKVALRRGMTELLMRLQRASVKMLTTRMLYYKGFVGWILSKERIVCLASVV